jgi:hypothetical protein
MMPNNADWKACRAQFHQTLSQENTRQWHRKQLRNARDYARTLLNDPDGLFGHNRT